MHMHGHGRSAFPNCAPQVALSLLINDRIASDNPYAHRKEGMHREAPCFASVEYDAQTAAGPAYIWAGMLSYGQNLAYPIAREQLLQECKQM